MCRAVDALQTEDSSMAERHKRQSESLSQSDGFGSAMFDFSLSLIRNKVEIVAGKLVCKVTTKSSVNRPILAVVPNY
jgi:hypothetical protein